MKYSLLMGVAALGCVAPSFAQIAETSAEELSEKRLETVSVTSLRPVQMPDLTSAVSVLDADLLEVREAPYLVDQLRAVPGVGVSQSGSKGTFTQVRLRGAEANHTFVLIDGIEVSDPVTGEVDFGLLSGLTAQRIEVARGEQSALYGSDAIGGVVSVITGGEGMRMGVEGGSHGTYQLNGAYDAEFGRGSAGFALSSFRTDGEDISGQGGEDDGATNQSVLLRGGLKLGGGWELNGLGRIGVSTTQSDPSKSFLAADYLVGGPLADADSETDSTQSLLGGVLMGDALGVNHALRVNFGETVRKNTQDGVFSNKTTGERIKASYSPAIEFGGDAVSHRIAGLVDYESEDYERNSVSYGSQSASFDTIGAALEYGLSAGGFAVNASVRHDDNDGRFDDATTWRLGGAYNFGFGGKLRASVGEGVKNPTFTELFGFYGFGFVGNPDLIPEKSQSYEIGWDQTIGTAVLSATYFQAELEDEIYTAFDAFFNSTPQNRTGASERQGVELTADWAVTPAFYLGAMASQITSENDSGADELRVPDWTGSLTFDWRSQQHDGARAGFAVDYVGEQQDSDFRFFPAAAKTLDSYVLLSASAAWPVHERISLTLRGENLLDEDAIDIFGYHKPGAGVFVGVTIR